MWFHISLAKTCFGKAGNFVRPRDIVRERKNNIWGTQTLEPGSAERDPSVRESFSPTK